MLEMLFKKCLLLFLILIVLVSIFVFNLLAILDLDNNDKTIQKNINCQQLDDNDYHQLNYSLRSHPANSGHNKYMETLLTNSNGFETNFVNISDNVFIYSAFETTNNVIVMIGFAKNYRPIKTEYNYFHYTNSYKVEEYQYYCGFDRSVQIKTEAMIDYLPESHDYYYSAIKVQCKRPKLFDPNISINRVKLIERPKLLNGRIKTFANTTIESDFVLIVNNNDNKLKSMDSNYVLVDSQDSNRADGSHRTDGPYSASTKELVVCVRPLYGNISAINLLEFIAYYRLNGINKIVFYNSISTRHMSKQTKQLFDLLSSVDAIELMPFFIPNNEELRPIIHANGQITAIHDCLYRFADYIQIHVDFDEYLKPSNTTIKDFLLSKEVSQSTAIVVTTVLFCDEFNENPGNRADRFLIENFNRQKTVWPHEVRSKVIIIRPVFITEMGIHKVWRLSPFYSLQRYHPILYSNSNQILIYHYRKCCNLIQPYFANIIHFHTINDYLYRDESMKPFLKRIQQFIDKYIEIIN